MKAKCLCEKVQFTFQPVDDVVMNCFCSMCRKSHGSAYATQVISKKSSLQFVAGEEYLKEYASSKYGVRAFCSECGSRLMNYARAHSDYMSVALSAVSSLHQLSPSANIQISSKADWVHYDESIDSYDGFPPNIKDYM